MSGQDWTQSQYYQEDFLASHSLQPGSDGARRMTVTSGRKCAELYRKSGPLGSLVRMLLGSSAWSSTRCFLTWKASATPAKRLLFRLVPSMPRTEETDAPFFVSTPTANMRKRSAKFAEGRTPTPAEFVQMWPTPTARDCKGTNSVEHLTREGKRNHLDQLPNAVKMWPTPTARCHQTPCEHGDGSPDLATSIGGQLNPTWVEWLMGFPLGWTDLDASETPSCPNGQG